MLNVRADEDTYKRVRKVCETRNIKLSTVIRIFVLKALNDIGDNTK